MKGFNDLSSIYPKLAKEWSAKNGEIMPSDVNERSTRNVWWKCSACGHEYKAVIKSRVHGLKCPVCTQRAVLSGFNDLATTDPELVSEWNFDRNMRSPSEISRLSLYPVWWKGACGHEWKDKVFNRAIEKAGCIYCEKTFQNTLPFLLVIMYARQFDMRAITYDESLIGMALDIVVPELRLAFVFPDKGTERERKIMDVLYHLCETRNIELVEVQQADPVQLCAEIKQAFAKAHLFIHTDSEKDISLVRERYFSMKKHRN